MNRSHIVEIKIKGKYYFLLQKRDVLLSGSLLLVNWQESNHLSHGGSHWLLNFGSNQHTCGSQMIQIWHLCIFLISNQVGQIFINDGTSQVKCLDFVLLLLVEVMYELNEVLSILLRELNDTLVDFIHVVANLLLTGSHLFVGFLGVLWGKLSSFSWVVQKSAHIFKIQFWDGLLQ